MILYKYVGLKGLDIIENLRIKVSNPKDFNDPFEFLPSIIDVSPGQADSEVFNNEGYLRRLHNYAISIGKTSKPYELYIEEIRSPDARVQIFKNFAGIAKALRTKCKELRDKSEEIALIACFCGESIERQQEILMWSHYTEGHKGLRIAFNTDFFGVQGSSFEEVKYGPNRVQLNPIDHFRGNTVNFAKVFGRLIFSKGSVWAYEKEHRWIISSKHCRRDGRDFFVRINPEAIVEVVCGVQCPQEQISLVKNLVRSKLGNEVKVRKAEIDDYEFKLNYSDIV